MQFDRLPKNVPDNPSYIGSYDQKKRKIQSLEYKRHFNAENSEGIVFITIILSIAAVIVFFKNQISNGAGIISSLFLSFILLIVAGFLIYRLLIVFYKAAINGKIERINHSIQKDQTEKAHNEAQYKAAFEAEAKRISTQYEGKTITLEIVNRVTDKLVREIEEAPRGNSIDTVKSGYGCAVYTDGVHFSSSYPVEKFRFGGFVFSEKRLEDLPGPLEQAAFAMAIGSAVYKKITDMYQNRSKDNDPIFTVTYSYPDHSSVHVWISYSAQNKYFKPLQKW